MSKKKKIENTPVVNTPEVVANNLLDALKDKYNTVLVVGIDKDGKIGVESTHPSYVTCQYLLARASFVLSANENFPQAKKEPEVAATN